MERYLVIKEVGYGTFGNVWRAINKENGEIVAIKKMKKKYYCWEECMNLREVKSLRKMNHPNIVKLKEVIREHDILYFIFEYMECNLYQLMKDRDEPFSESDIRNWCFQVFQALAYMHQQGYFHRDLKPENLLLSGDVIKVADFGLAREIPSKPPFTEYVSTRWYRAPEVLLQSSVYDPAVDAWAMGAIMAELFNLHPLFPGTDEADELHKICSVIGSPNQNSWVEGLHLADAMNFQFPQYPGIHLSRLIPSASGYAISLISSLCSWNPLRRPTAAMALQHPFFKACYYIPPSLRDTKSLKTPPSASEHLNARRFSVGASTHNKPASNAPSSATYSSLRTVGGPQRKLDMYQSHDYDVPLQMPPNMPPARNNHPGCIGRVVHPNPIASSGRVADLADKLASLSMSSGPRWLAGPPPPQPAALKAGSWHSHNRHLSRPYEMPPPARGCCYPRKAVG